jgi:putative ABC transport system ATP-binding protein/macrolide transport system ATP-binding/permease protein/lipoprotein-releasing system ATP-binding protein
MNLSAHSLTKRYGAASNYEALRDASLELRAGEFVSIVGRSGSGKSTLLAMLGALTPPTAGTILLDGTDIWALTEIERAAFRCRQIGFIFQFSSLLSNLTAVDNVAVPALLGRTMETKTAYARAHDLLAHVGLGERANADPGTMSGGEQRRVVIARALINSPRLLLADEPTSDLDEDSEADIMDLLDALRSSEGFGFVLVTHNLKLAGRAQRTYEMRQGVLAAAVLPEVGDAAARRPRHFGPGDIRVRPDLTPRPRKSIHLGANLLHAVATLLLGGAAVIAGVLLLDFGVAKYQQIQVRERAQRIGRLADTALSSLQSDIQSVADLGDGHYQLAVYLLNASGDEQIFVMLQDMRAYVQVGNVWQEVPLRPADDGAEGVLRIDGRHVYQYLFDAQVRGFTQLLPNYMHVRFSDTMLVSPSSTPQDDVFERRDNYYIYLKPSGVTDDIILKKMKFSGKPPVWIPMPPH